MAAHSGAGRQTALGESTSTRFPYAHRGAALKYVNNPDIDIFTEDSTELRFPRSCFKAPVELGIFWYGYPNEIDEDQGIPAEEAMMRDEVPVDEAGNFQPSQASQPNQNKEIYQDEIIFPNSTGIDKSIKLSVSRMLSESWTSSRPRDAEAAGFEWYHQRPGDQMHQNSAMPAPVHEPHCGQIQPQHLHNVLVNLLRTSRKTSST